MKIELKVTKTFDVKFLKAKCGVRYWEDATVNGEKDTDGVLIPFRNGDNWEPLIDIEKGLIVNWPNGQTASVHYKCCDDGTYILLDENMSEIVSIEGYVPKIMCPRESGYGDYVIMDIDENGLIQKFKPLLNEFYENED